MIAISLGDPEGGVSLLIVTIAHALIKRQNLMPMIGFLPPMKEAN